MTKRFFITVLAMAGMLSVSCLRDDVLPVPEAPDGYVNVSFSADMPVMEDVYTKAVDLDGGGVQTMVLFCFDTYGTFITKVDAVLNRADDLSGSYEATIPEHTKRIHFVANQNMDNIPDSEFYNKAEGQSMEVLEATSGRMIYWGRFVSATDNIRTELEGNTISLIRNHAKVSVQVDAEAASAFTLTGMNVYNTNAFGTVCPWHPVDGFDFDWATAKPFVTLPANDAKVSDVVEVTSSLSRYVFETQNSYDDPVSVIIKGSNAGGSELYYRAMLVDADGDQIVLQRNHNFIVNIKGPLSYGQSTFAEAVKAPATNNVWISISDAVNEVESTEYILTVEKYDHVISGTDSDQSYTLKYTLKGKNGTTVSADSAPSVTWLDGNNVAYNEFTNSFAVVDGVGQGTVQLNLLPMGGEEMRSGTLLVKHGFLQRKMKVITIRQQEFDPVWVTSQIFGGSDSSSGDLYSNVTVVFTVPETTPAELFPFNVLVSTNNLDVRTFTGEEDYDLPVVRKGEEGYFGEDNAMGYKYVFEVTTPGVQRVYFTNQLYSTSEDGDVIWLEAEFFNTSKHQFGYSENNYEITTNSLPLYGAELRYLLVPQKINAPVNFPIELWLNKAEGQAFEATVNDEFLIFTQHLDITEDGECNYFAMPEIIYGYGNNGRSLAFKPAASGASTYNLSFKTNRPVSAEVINLESIPSGSSATHPFVGKSVFKNITGIGNLVEQGVLTEEAVAEFAVYNGIDYRSTTFELSNYRAFEFNAAVKYDGTDDTSWPYIPEVPVNVEFDVTTFVGADGKTVDPFGTAFNVYIDAPMLEIDRSRIGEYDGKLTEVSEGRFAYAVDEDWETEDGFGSNGRKSLPFKVKTSAVSGDITVTADASIVIFNSQTITITDDPIRGTITYGDDNAAVAAGEFVAFELVSNGNRIGSVTIGTDGQYELRLRKEYKYSWTDDEIVFTYEPVNDTNIYEVVFDSLKDLYENPTVHLAGK